MSPHQLAAFVKQQLPAAWQAVRAESFRAVSSRFNITDRALIYHYTDRGFASLNNALHALPGAQVPIGQALTAALQKLPHYQGLVYSGAYLSPLQLRHYHRCLAKGTTISWPAFLSASTSFDIAEWHLGMATPARPKNCLFFLDSRTGRDVAPFSCYGPNGPKSNEYEVLFIPDTQFWVLEIVAELQHTRITLAEV